MEVFVVVKGAILVMEVLVVVKRTSLFMEVFLLKNYIINHCFVLTSEEDSKPRDTSSASLVDIYRTRY